MRELKCYQNANDASNSPTTEDRLGLNYREIFQSVGASNRKTIKGNNEAPSKSVISIEEVNDDDFGGEETAACIIEEKDTHPILKRDPCHVQGESVSCV